MGLDKCDVCNGSLKLNKLFVLNEEKSLRLFNYYHKDKPQNKHYAVFETYSKNERRFRKWER